MMFAVALQDVGESVVLAGAVLAALTFICGFAWKGFRKIDKLSGLPGEMAGLSKQQTELKQQAADDSDRHEAAHVEMLRAVDGVKSSVEDLDKRLDRIERRVAQERELARRGW